MYESELHNAVQEPELVDQIVERFGGVRSVFRLGQSSQVWRLSTDSGTTLFIKKYTQSRKFSQAKHAFLEWLPRLRFRTPELLAFSRSALLISEVTGRPFVDLELDLRRQRLCFQQAGDFLRQLHSLEHHDTDSVSLEEAYSQRLESGLIRADGKVENDRLRWIEDRVREVLPLLSGVARVPCHRDFSPGNWLVECDSLGVIDFEHCRSDLALIDLVHLVDIWTEDTSLEEAFLSGYGRRLPREEETLLKGCRILFALNTLNWGNAHGDPTLISQGRAALDRLQTTASS